MLYTHIHTCTHAFPQNVTIWVVLLKYFWLFCLFFLLWWPFFLNQKNQNTAVRHMVVILAYDIWTESCVIKTSQKVGIYGVLLIMGEVFVFICGFALPLHIFSEPKNIQGYCFLGMTIAIQRFEVSHFYYLNIQNTFQFLLQVLIWFMGYLKVFFLFSKQRMIF